MKENTKAIMPSTEVLTTGLEWSAEFKKKIADFKKEFFEKYKKISQETTPQVDGNGRKIVDKRPDGYDYIIEAYMRECLDKHFPGWSWEGAGQNPVGLLGAEVVYIGGHLVIIDEHLIPFGINPPVRKFFGVGAARIQFKSKAEHIAENLIDFDKNIKAADTNAFKYAVNRLTHIGDDIYGKRIEEEGAGTYESILESKSDANAFGQWVVEHKISWSEVMVILGVSNMTEVTDYQEAFRKVKKAKGIE